MGGAGHTDGWQGDAAARAARANLKPDFFFLVCEAACPIGGASFLVDGLRIFQQLPPDVQSELRRGSARTGGGRRGHIDATAQGRLIQFNADADDTDGEELRAQREAVAAARAAAAAAPELGAETGRLRDRSNAAQLELEVEKAGLMLARAEGAAERAVALFTRAVFVAQAHAPRFRLAPGQALLCDNYRVHHGRDAYRVRSSRESFAAAVLLS